MGRSCFHPQGVLAGLLVLSGVGCGLFDTRDPRPAEIPFERCRAQSQPDSVITNIRLHYGAASACYGDQLADSLDPGRPGFRFHPDIQDSLSRLNPPLPSPYERWNKAVETSVTQNVSASHDTVVVIFGSEYASRVTSTNPARETRFYNYSLWTVGASADTTRYQGQAELTLIQVTSNWYLETFVDHRDGSGLPTWGSLRADHRIVP